MALIAQVAHLGRVSARVGELMLKTAIEIQTGIVVAFGDNSAASIADDEDGIDLLAEAIADDFKANALACLHRERETIRLCLAESSPECAGRIDSRRLLRGIRPTADRQVIDQAQ